MTHLKTTFRALCCTALLVGGAHSFAAPAALSGDSAESRYQLDRQACLSGNTQQARDVCLREAGAARDAARKGALQSDAGTDTSANAISRCEVFKEADQHAACLDRIRGAGTKSGSAMEGGVLRESVTTTVVEPK